MRMLLKTLPVAALLPLVACSVAPESNQTTSATTAPVETSASGVTRAEVVPSPTPTVAAQTVIQTQPASSGTQVALNKVAVTGDVLTVQLTYTGGTASQVIAADEVSVIDDANARQLGVLKDNAGKWLAAPLTSSGDQLIFSSGRAPVIVWFKFPAPAGDSKTVSINIPGTAPFDGVPVTR
ncbi:hypothetical protein [Sphingomonas sp. LT1P40]|uniref:hypothetical protein n=1 Tax=Alteristakelama amylovorans TaxID=3096166 RepID=UPI002FC78FA1